MDTFWANDRPTKVVVCIEKSDQRQVVIEALEIVSKTFMPSAAESQFPADTGLLRPITV
jgi:hypothetical protein